MFGIPEQMVGVVVWVGITFMIAFYCCFCFLFCRRNNQKKNLTHPLGKTHLPPRRLVEIHCQETNSGPSSTGSYEYPVVERARVPCQSQSCHHSDNGILHLHHHHHPAVATVSVIDTHTKLSLNPQVVTEEPPPSYDALFP